jgi:hypothetical protein
MSTKPNRQVDEIRDLLVECLDHHGGHGCGVVSIDDTEIGIIDYESGLVWLITVKAAVLQAAGGA